MWIDIKYAPYDVFLWTKTEWDDGKITQEYFNQTSSGSWQTKRNFYTLYMPQKFSIWLTIVNWFKKHGY